MNYKGNVLITGASSGIGAATAIHLARLGFKVFAGVRKQTDADNLSSQNPGRIIPILIDIRDQLMIDTAYDWVALETGTQGLTGLINNAGIGFGAPIECIPIQQLKEVFEVDVFGHIKMIQKFLPLLRHTQGRIINISSISGQLPQPFQSTYSAAKMALESFSDSLRIELRPWNIKISIIEPGSIKTPIWSKSNDRTQELFAQFSPELQELYRSSITAFNYTADKFSHLATGSAVVAKAIEHALTAKHPRSRYLVGKDAFLMYYLLKPLPALIRDWTLAKIMGLPRKGSMALF